MGACSKLARVQVGVGGDILKNNKGERKGGKERREEIKNGRKEEVKKQGQYTQRNVVLQDSRTG